MWPNPQETADLAIFTEEMISMENFFVCAVNETKIQSVSSSSIFYGFQRFNSESGLYFKNDIFSWNNWSNLWGKGF